MSPASAGPLEVERYIGACLISSHARPNHHKGCASTRDVFYPRETYLPDMYNTTGSYLSLDARFRPRRCSSAVDGWAGGMPLISFTNTGRRTGRRLDHHLDNATRSSSPRVADEPPVAVPFTPLSRLAVHTQGLPLILSSRHGNRRNKASRNASYRSSIDASKKVSDCKDNSGRGVDSLSVASDESSGSNNSENSLPRIIKPRKRRKKDRKPHPPRSDNIVPGFSSNIVTLKPYAPLCYERYYDLEHVLGAHRDAASPASSVLPPEDSVSKVGDVLSETPQLHHRFEDVEGVETDGSEPSVCQCRYCDPASHIWDVGRHCYSPCLTPPAVTTERISAALQRQCLISKIALDVAEDTTVKPCPDDQDECRPNRTYQCLEITTKIVTSPNGHRDLEIRLFSSCSSEESQSTKSTKNPSQNIDKCSDVRSVKDKYESRLTPEE